MRDRSLIDHMNQYYDLRAPWHDYYMSYTSNDEMEALLAPVIRLFEKHVTGRDVLEVACGTGNWTQVLARRARSVVATDVNRSVLDIARTKGFESQVEFRQMDAYALDELSERFDVGFAGDWFSHIPKASISEFIEGLHRRLHRQAKVIFLDMMPRKEFDAETAYFDSDGNRVSERPLPDGTIFHVVKNFPQEDELRAALDPFATDIEYFVDEPLKRWMVIYTRI